MRIPPPSQIVINAADIIRRLQDFVLDDPSALTDAEVSALLSTLDAALPDLAGVEVEMAVWHLH